MKLADLSIKRPVTTFMVMVAMTVFGFIAFQRLPINLLPDISYPTLTVRTNYPGTAPHEVETLVSKRVEEAVGVIPGVVRVSSISRPGRSDVVVEFAWKTNMDFAALDIRERLDMITLPDDAEAPLLLRFDPSLDPIMRIGLTGKDSLVALRLVAEDEIKPSLESLATDEGEGGGVAAVKISGGLEEEIHVDVDEAKLSSLGLSMQQVVSRLQQENVNLTGGTLKDGEAEYLVRTLNEFRTVDEIDDIVLAMRDDRAIVLRDVAQVTRSHRERTVITRIDGSESVELAVYKEADANTVSVAKLVKERIGQIQTELALRATTAQLHIVSDQSRFIQQSTDDVLRTAQVGGVLAIAVLYLFLRHFGSTVIVGLSIPLSVVATFFFMYSSHVTLNIMSLGGLALGIGMLVDNAIVVLESIDRSRAPGVSNADAASLGTQEVGRAVVASTLTTVCVFFPIVFVQGIAGQLFQDQALTVTASLLVSLFVALTCIPMLSALPIWGLGRQAGEAGAGGPGPSRLARMGVGVAVLVFLAGALGVTAMATGSGPRFARALGLPRAWLDWTGTGPGKTQALACVWALFIVLCATASGSIHKVFAAQRQLWRSFRDRLGFNLARLALWGLLAMALLLPMVDPALLRHMLPEALPKGAPGFASEEKLGELLTRFGHGAINFCSTPRWAWTLAAVLGAYAFLRLGGGMVVAAVIAMGLREVARVVHVILWPVVCCFNAVLGSLMWAYPLVIRAALSHKFIVVGASVFAVWASAELFGSLGSELIPELSQSQLNVDFQLPVGTPLAETLEAAEAMERIVRRDPAVVSTYSIIGTTGQTGGFASEELEHIGQLSLTLRPGVERAGEEAAMNRLRGEFDKIPALQYNFSRPALFSFATPVEVEASGYNLAKLEQASAQVAQMFRGVKGLTDIKTSLEGGTPELQILFDREKTARLGLDISTIAALVRNNVEGDVATEFSREDRKVGIRVRAHPDVLSSVQALERLTVNPRAATPIPLAAVAEVVATAGPSEIRRIGGERVALITANLRDRDLRSAVLEIEGLLDRMVLPRDFDVRVSGQSREMSTAFSSMRFAIALAAFLVYLVMASQFESLLHPFVIMFTIPFGLVGVVLALYVTSTPISVIVLIGVVMLAGIVVNNAIVLVDCVNNRVREGMPREEAIVEAGRMRLRPIMMTTATTVLGLLPMALGWGQGSELRTPMAITVIGGLLTSTVLTLVFVPTVYDVVEGLKDAVLGLLRRVGYEDRAQSQKAAP